MSSDITIFVDAARDDEVTGLGYVITGEVSHSGRKYMCGHYTSMEAELHSLLEAVRIASMESEEREYCEVYTDCRPLVRKVRGSEPSRNEWTEYRKSALWLLNKFEAWDVTYKPRSSNEEAHEIARNALAAGRRDL